MERLTYKTNGKYMNTVIEQAPSYAIDCDIDTAITKLAQYENLEEQGKLLKLPCAVGDTVYEVQRVRKRIQPYDIVAIKISRMGERYYYWELKDGKGFYGNLKGFGDMRLGVDVFPTQEAAEAALKERTGEI